MRRIAADIAELPGSVAARLIDSVGQHALDQVKAVNDRVRPEFIGEDRANRNNQISSSVTWVTAFPIRNLFSKFHAHTYFFSSGDGMGALGESFLVRLRDRRRFSKPWRIEETSTSFIVRDNDGEGLAYLYFEDDKGRGVNLHTRCEALRIAAKIATMV